MKLVVAIVHPEDAGALVDALTDKDFRVTRLHSQGGFLVNASGFCNAQKTLCLSYRVSRGKAIKEFSRQPPGAWMRPRSVVSIPSTCRNQPEASVSDLSGRRLLFHCFCDNLHRSHFFHTSRRPGAGGGTDVCC